MKRRYNTISRLNKSKRWEYGYNKENDIVVISKTGQIGEVLEIQGLKIALPLAPKSVYKRSGKKKEQKNELKRKKMDKTQTLLKLPGDTVLAIPKIAGCGPIHNPKGEIKSVFMIHVDGGVIPFMAPTRAEAKKTRDYILATLAEYYQPKTTIITNNKINNIAKT